MALFSPIILKKTASPRLTVCDILLINFSKAATGLTLPSFGASKSIV